MTVMATPEGMERYAGDFVAPSTTDEVLDIWRPKLGRAANQILDHLIGLGGQSVSRGDLAAAIGTTLGGGFSGRLSEVRSTGLITDLPGGKVAANEQMLFL